MADLTPLMDTICQIIFLLLAMLIGSSVVGGLPVNLPAVSNSAGVQKEDGEIEISIDRDGNIRVGKELVSQTDLERVLQPLAARSPAQKVFVRADTGVAYGRVATVLSRLSSHLPGREIDLIVQKTDSESIREGSPRKEALDR
ncbi:MAG: hypothetical protein A2Y76_09290 [Planctomycetes bacterium RBG_13_60_9]|nr:MAG: hypothetical protein A2Y76_09290 [Planctomycetes bacterium RBG_13_60_9]